MHKLNKYGQHNGVQGLRIIAGDQARELEPYVSDKVQAALYCEQAGVTSPYEFVSP
ncbi:hypothetical protein [Sporomusa acidovorans]|uniref:hypothetical protein n=1 Tax=Sporomusa acidovorans TaxID=112900 RepID=UPI001FE00D81|nr:hypothetical protein [Sporomusa acidovorans]